MDMAYKEFGLISCSLALLVQTSPMLSICHPEINHIFWRRSLQFARLARCVVLVEALGKISDEFPDNTGRPWASWHTPSCCIYRPAKDDAIAWALLSLDLSI